MPNQQKYERILDALQELLENHKLQSISVSEIAETAGIGREASTTTFLPRTRSWRPWWSEATKSLFRQPKRWQDAQKSPRLSGWR